MAGAVTASLSVRASVIAMMICWRSSLMHLYKITLTVPSTNARWLKTANWSCGGYVCQNRMYHDQQVLEDIRDDLLEMCSMFPGLLATDIVFSRDKS